MLDPAWLWLYAGHSWPRRDGLRHRHLQLRQQPAAMRPMPSRTDDSCCTSGVHRCLHGTSRILHAGVLSCLSSLAVCLQSSKVPCTWCQHRTLQRPNSFWLHSTVLLQVYLQLRAGCVSTVCLQWLRSSTSRHASSSDWMCPVIHAPCVFMSCAGHASPAMPQGYLQGRHQQGRDMYPVPH
jgi:hypothetical protein